jgi:hypothetical protein
VFTEKKFSGVSVRVCVYFLNITHSAEETGFLTMQCLSFSNRTKFSRDNIYILGLSAPYGSSFSQKFPIKARKRQTEEKCYFIGPMKQDKPL